jgi:tetratricopeptide (TPR) repeat protein
MQIYLCALPDLARAYEGLGARDSAIVVYERCLFTGQLFRFDLDRVELAPTYFRLGELYEGKGDRAKAADYYGRFVELWRNGDPDVQPRVTEVKRRLAALAAERTN